MKIEIEVDMDESEWELAERQLFKQATDITHLAPYKAILTFRRRADPHAWKQNIEWPSVLEEFTWIARDVDGAVYVYRNKPDWYEPRQEWMVAPDCSECADITFFNLSFLPPEFFSCAPSDSLIEVRHGGEG
jgi:hypothetical protein